MNILAIQIVAVVGLLASIYAVYVDNKANKEKEYKAVCDINDHISCTKAFSSQYAKTFGISNSILGILFYAVILGLSFLQIPNIVLYLSIAAVLGSLYLGYISYFKLKNFCLVCGTIYVVNILLLIFSLR